MAHAVAPEPFAAAPGRPFWRELVATRRVWGSSLVAFAAAGYWLAGVWDAQRMVHGVGWLAVGLVVVPFAFALALTLVALVLTAGLALLSLPAWLCRRATGLAAVLIDLWRLAGHVLPGYWRALRRVRQPGLWGGLAGLVVGVALFAVVEGLAR